jgi:hypothetical protein
MRKGTQWTAAIASIVLAGLTFRPTPSAADQPANPANRDTNAAAAIGGRVQFTLPPGINAKDLKEDKDIRSAFGAYEKAAVEKNGFKNVIDCLVDQDRDRLKKEYKEEKTDALNDVIAKLQGQWKTKYNQDFDITRSERQKAFSGIVIQTGEVANPEQLAGNWPIAQAVPTTEAQTAASKQDIDQAKNKTFGGDVNLDKGRDVAIAQVPEAFGLPEVRCSLIKEHVSGWRFDISNSMNGQMLHDSLVKHLQMVTDHPEQWPSDIDQAYGLVGHHVLMALYNVEMPSSNAK